ncbi:hypothetical protein IQ265_28370 [Nodosilinea sp. LEGE 06152]|uniref:hypothetical protein n=1 Tax=Nodosilinea sp. LEGE 06152 TaxID=2777966 RepID=UPI00187DF279|nr:hypothetical protein [Nodosilinea sp. LEGE 06152]MBE9160708.1 hypothetical protein [Nodosilinea sp. LEGE 06152]
MATRNTDPRNRDFEASINARPVTNDEIAYRDGYVRGKSTQQLEQERRRAAEARIYEENARLREDSGVSTGLILGLTLAALAAVIGGLIYVYSEENATPGVTNPTPEAVTPEPANNETTIIERTIERTQEVVPAPSSVQPPEVNVELNNPVQAPAPAPAQPEAPAAPVQPEAGANQAPAGTQ